jgi:hypothetical protein
MRILGGYHKEIEKCGFNVQVDKDPFSLDGAFGKINFPSALLTSIEDARETRKREKNVRLTVPFA